MNGALVLDGALVLHSQIGLNGQGFALFNGQRFVAWNGKVLGWGDIGAVHLAQTSLEDHTAPSAGIIIVLDSTADKTTAGKDDRIAIGAGGKAAAAIASRSAADARSINTTGCSDLATFDGDIAAATTAAADASTIIAAGRSDFAMADGNLSSSAIIAAADASSTTAAGCIVLSALGGVCFIGATIAEGLRPQHRRRLLSRARARGHPILTPARWEGARILRADALAPDTGIRNTPSVQAPAETPAEPSADGVVIPIGRGASPAPVRAIEMPAGYLQRLTWTLADPQRPRPADTEELTLSLSAEGLRTGSRNAVDTADPTSHPQEVAG